MEFEWDPKKALENERKHGISFEEASSVFGDPFAITFNDRDHSWDEHQFVTFGVTRLLRPIVVAHADREGHYRIISARLMTRGEREIYEEGC